MFSLNPSVKPDVIHGISNLESQKYIVAGKRGHSEFRIQQNRKCTESLFSSSHKLWSCLSAPEMGARHRPETLLGST